MNKIIIHREILPGVILGLLLRLTTIIIYPIQPRDSYTYINFIESWESNSTIPIINNLDIPPFSLYMLKLPHELWGIDLLSGGIIINMITGIGIIIVFSKIVSLLFPQKTIIFLSGIVFASHPTLINYSIKFLRENTYLFFTAITLYFGIIFYKKKSIISCFLASFFSCLTFMCRYEGVELILFFIISILFFSKNKISIQQKLKYTTYSVIVYVATFFAVLRFLNIPIEYYRPFYETAIHAVFK